MGDNRPVFLIVTSDTCGPCIMFKKDYLEKVLSIMRRHSNIRTIHLNLPERRINKFVGTHGEQIPESITKIIHGFPSFIVISGPEWNASVSNRSDLTDYIVLNARTLSSFNENTITRWVLAESSKRSNSIRRMDIAPPVLRDTRNVRKGVDLNEILERPLDENDSYEKVSPNNRNLPRMVSQNNDSITIIDNDKVPTRGNVNLLTGNPSRINNFRPY